MTEYVKIERNVYPSCKIPENKDQIVWHYMDAWKFELLISKKSLYLCRADKLQDQFEGCSSRQQIDGVESFLKDKNVESLSEGEREWREENRKSTYISCWCMADCDYDLMWKSYVRSPPGVAIKSTVYELSKLCNENIEYWPLDLSQVVYFDQAGGAWISYDRLTPFHHKDAHFKLDNELRIMHWPSFSGGTPEDVEIPADLVTLVKCVVVSPQSPRQYVEHVKSSLVRAGLASVPVEFSRYDREYVE